MTNEQIEAKVAECAPRIRLMMRCARWHLPTRKKGTSEAQVLALASIGFTDNDIAQKFGLNPDTVGTYWTRVLRPPRCEQSHRGGRHPAPAGDRSDSGQ